VRPEKVLLRLDEIPRVPAQRHIDDYNPQQPQLGEGMFTARYTSADITNHLYPSDPIGVAAGSCSR
jgi:hypothetical protein